MTTLGTWSMCVGVTGFEWYYSWWWLTMSGWERNSGHLLKWILFKSRNERGNEQFLNRSSSSREMHPCPCQGNHGKMRPSISFLFWASFLISSSRSTDRRFHFIGEREDIYLILCPSDPNLHLSSTLFICYIDGHVYNLVTSSLDRHVFNDVLLWPFSFSNNNNNNNQYMER